MVPSNAIKAQSAKKANPEFEDVSILAVPIPTSEIYIALDWRALIAVTLLGLKKEYILAPMKVINAIPRPMGTWPSAKHINKKNNWPKIMQAWLKTWLKLVWMFSSVKELLLHDDRKKLKIGEIDWISPGTWEARLYSELTKSTPREPASIIPDSENPFCIIETTKRAVRMPEFMLSLEADNNGESGTLKYPQRLDPA